MEGIRGRLAGRSAVRDGLTYSYQDLPLLAVPLVAWAGRSHHVETIHVHDVPRGGSVEAPEADPIDSEGIGRPRDIRRPEQAVP